eukprot:SAG22_NODE_529_length_9428_cov_2.691178_5_plen_154_part_00
MVQHARHKELHATFPHHVEDLLDLLGVADRDLDRVARRQRVEPERRGLVVRRELLPHAPVREERVGGVGLHPGREALVEPEIVPPFHRDQVAEPLVGQLVRHDRADPLLLARRGLVGVDQLHVQQAELWCQAPDHLCVCSHSLTHALTRSTSR